ncbi:MAG: hypothetical protein JZD41_00120 [Thermoproteus sp.]|nr:hypothetical protein [Thermoproteus sp.]
MELIIVYSDDEELANRIFNSVPCIKLAPSLAVTWEPEDRIRRAIEQVKDKVIRRWEERGKGPRLEFAVLALSEDQFNAIRHIVRRALDDIASRLAEELRRFAADVRRRRGPPGELKARFGRLAKRSSRLVEAALKLGLLTSAVAQVQEALKEANAEVMKL